MATTIKLKNGSGAPLAGDLVQGEPALDLTNKRLYTEDSGGTVIEVGTNPTSLTTGTFTSTGIDDNATSTAITIDSSENVGIGTSSPTTPMHIQNSAVSPSWSAYAGTTLTLEDASSQGTILQFIAPAAYTSEIWFGDADARNSGRIRYEHTDNKLELWSNGAERVAIDDNGNLLIGTTDGAFVNGGGVKIANTQAARLKLCDSDTAGTGVSDGFEITQAGTQAYIFQNENDFMAFGTNASERMRIDSSGNVGIGTTSPSTSLDVVRAGVQPLRLQSTSGTEVAINMVNTGGNVQLEAHSGNFNIDADNVGIGTTSPASKLSVNSGADNTTLALESTDAACWLTMTDPSGTVFFGNTGGDYALFTSGSERMRIDSSGNVGIGTTAPSATNYKYLAVHATTNAYLHLTNSTTGSTSADGFDVVVSGSDASLINREATGAIRLLTNGSERMRIDSSGRLLVGKSAVSNSTAGYFLEPGSGGYASFVNTASSASNRCLLLNRHGASNGRIIEFRSANLTCGHIAARGGTTASFVGYPNSGNGAGIGGSSNMMIPTNEDGTAQDNRIQLGSTSTRWKHLYLSGSVFLGGTGSGNQLDDYEVGNWIPTASSGFTSLAYDTSNCRYTKIGNTVHVRGEISTIGGQTAATFVVGGLPFSVATSVESTFSLMYNQINIDTNYTQLVGYAQAGSSNFRIYECGDSQNWSAVIGTQTSSSTSIIFALTYETS